VFVYSGVQAQKCVHSDTSPPGEHDPGLLANALGTQQPRRGPAGTDERGKTGGCGHWVLPLQVWCLCVCWQALPVFWPEQEGIDVEYGMLMVNLTSQRQVKGCTERKINIRGERVSEWNLLWVVFRVWHRSRERLITEFRWRSSTTRTGRSVVVRCPRPPSCTWWTASAISRGPLATSPSPSCAGEGVGEAWHGVGLRWGWSEDLVWCKTGLLGLERSPMTFYGTWAIPYFWARFLLWDHVIVQGQGLSRTRVYLGNKLWSKSRD